MLTPRAPCTLTLACPVRSPGCRRPRIEPAACVSLQITGITLSASWRTRRKGGACSREAHSHCGLAHSVVKDQSAASTAVPAQRTATVAVLPHLLLHWRKAGRCRLVGARPWIISLVSRMPGGSTSRRAMPSPLRPICPRDLEVEEIEGKAEQRQEQDAKSRLSVARRQECGAESESACAERDDRLRGSENRCPLPTAESARTPCRAFWRAVQRWSRGSPTDHRCVQDHIAKFAGNSNAVTVYVAPRCLNSLTISTWPARVAIASGVCPSSALAFTFAPPSRSA